MTDVDRIFFRHPHTRMDTARRVHTLHKPHVKRDKVPRFWVSSDSPRPPRHRAMPLAVKKWSSAMCGQRKSMTREAASSKKKTLVLVSEPFKDFFLTK
jgi:hypothetical protein